MSLTSALESAKSAIAANSAQTAIVSRNIANVNSTTATRKQANVSTGPGGGVVISSIAQSTNLALFRNKLDATSENSAWTVVNDGLKQIHQTVGDTADATSPAALIGALNDALVSYSSNPDSADLARSALQSAKNFANALNDASTTVETVRKDADDSLAIAASEMNDLLAQFKTLNDKIVKGSFTGADVTDYVDERDTVVSQLSEYVGLTVRTSGNNDMALYTDSGVTLFEGSARTVSFNPTVPISAGQPGNAFMIDGVVVTGENATMPLKSGKVFGLVQLRDDISITYQNQLDQMARTLVDAFSEGTADAPAFGVFSDPTAHDVLAVTTNGLAGRITVPDNLSDFPFRDGAATDYNPGDNAGYSGRINQLIDNMNATVSFDRSGDLETSTTLADFAASSVGWLEGVRSNSASQRSYYSTILQRTEETLSDKTGINLDDELTKMLQYEHSYQASAKLISAVDEMLKILLNSVN